MKQLLLYLVVPVSVAIWAFLASLRVEPTWLHALAFEGVLGFLYYAAPHLLWAFLAALFKASGAVRHAGFIAANIVLVAIASISIEGVHDQSGLPMQWVAYWPYALVLQALFVAVAAAIRYGRSRARA